MRLLPADQFYLTLTAHGIDMLIFWIIFFEIAVLYFCASTLLRSRLATPRMAWLGVCADGDRLGGDPRRNLPGGAQA